MAQSRTAVLLRNQAGFSWLYRVFNIAFAALVTGIIGIAIFYNLNTLHTFNPWLLLLCVVLGTLFFWLLYRVILMLPMQGSPGWLEPTVVIIVFATFVILQCYAGWLLRVDPLDGVQGWDFSVVFTDAQNTVVHGILPSVEEEYYLNFPNDTGIYVLWCLFFSVLKQMGVSDFTLPAMLLNLFSIDLAVYLLYRAARLMFGKRRGLFALLAAMCTLPLLLYIPIYYNDTLTMAFPIGCAYLWLRTRRMWRKGEMGGAIGRYVALSVVAALGAQLKMTVLIIWIAATIDLLVTLAGKGRVRMLLAGAGAGAAVFFGAWWLVHNNGFLPAYGVGGGVPFTHWIMMGLSGNGGYNNADYQLTLQSGLTKADRYNFTNVEIGDRMTNLGFGGTLGQLLRKLSYTFGDGTYFAPAKLDRPGVTPGTWLHGFVLPGSSNFAVVAYGSFAVHAAMLVGMLVSAIKSVYRKNDALTFARVAIFGLILFLLVWETRSRYLVNFLPLMLLVGMEPLPMHRRRKRQKEKRVRPSAPHQAPEEEGVPADPVVDTAMEQLAGAMDEELLATAAENVLARVFEENGGEDTLDGEQEKQDFSLFDEAVLEAAPEVTEVQPEAEPNEEPEAIEPPSAAPAAEPVPAVSLFDEETEDGLQLASMPVESSHIPDMPEAIAPAPAVLLFDEELEGKEQPVSIPVESAQISDVPEVSAPAFSLFEEAVEDEVQPAITPVDTSDIPDVPMDNAPALAELEDLFAAFAGETQAPQTEAPAEEFNLFEMDNGEDNVLPAAPTVARWVPEAQPMSGSDLFDEELETTTIPSETPLAQDTASKERMVEEESVEQLFEAFAAQPVEEPAKQLFEEKVEGLVQEPVESLFDEPAGQPVEPLFETPAELFTEAPATLFEAEIPAEPSVEELVESPVAESVEDLFETLSEQPMEVIAERLFEEPAEPFVEATVEQLFDTPQELPIEQLAQEISAPPVETILDQPVEQFIEQFMERPVDPPEPPMVEETVEPAEQPPEQPASLFDAPITTRQDGVTTHTQLFDVPAGDPFWELAHSTSWSVSEVQEGVAEVERKRKNPPTSELKHAPTGPLDEAALRRAYPNTNDALLRAAFSALDNDAPLRPDDLFSQLEAELMGQDDGVEGHSPAPLPPAEPRPGEDS